MIIWYDRFYDIVTKKYQKKLKKLLTEEMKFSILNKLLFEAADISKGFEKKFKKLLDKALKKC